MVIGAFEDHFEFIKARWTSITLDFLHSNIAECLSTTGDI